jgi:hypothetical protein
MNIQASTPASRKWISPLCNTSWSTRENIVPRHMSCISAAFHFHHLPNNFSLPFYDEMKQQYSNSPRTQENWMRSVSQLWCKCLFATLGKACRCIGRAWHCTKNVPCTLPWTSTLSLVCSLVKRLEYLKDVTKMRNLPAESQWFYCFKLFYGTRESEYMSSITSRNYFVMQKYSVKKQEAFLQYATKLQEKLKTEYNFFV